MVIRSHKSKRSRLYNGQKVKDNNKTTIYRNTQLVSILGLGHLWTEPYGAPFFFLRYCNIGSCPQVPVVSVTYIRLWTNTILKKYFWVPPIRLKCKKHILCFPSKLLPMGFDELYLENILSIPFPQIDWNVNNTFYVLSSKLWPREFDGLYLENILSTPFSPNRLKCK